MLACLSPNGRADYPTDGRITRLLVGTIKGVHALERRDPSSQWQITDTSLEGRQISSLVLEPRSGVVFAGIAGHGLYASADQGRTWEPRASGLRIDHIFAMAVDERGSQPALYAGTLPPALFRSRDMGQSWQELATLNEIPDSDKWNFRAPPGAPHVKNIAFHPTEPNTFFVCIEQGGLTKTSDSGQTWTELFAWQQDVGAGAALVDTQARAMAPRQFIGKTVDLQQVERMTAHEVNFLQQHTQGQAFKVTMPGDGHFAGNAFKAGITDQVYRTRLDMARDIAMVQRREIEALIAQGVPYIQLDSLRYVIQLADPERREAIKAAGINPETDLDDTIKVGTNLLAAV